MGKKSGETKL